MDNWIEKRVPFTYFVNEYVDYEILLRICYCNDGQRIVELEDETIKIFDEDGVCRDSFTVTMPKSVKDKALEYGNEYEMRF